METALAVIRPGLSVVSRTARPQSKRRPPFPPVPNASAIYGIVRRNFHVFSSLTMNMSSLPLWQQSLELRGYSARAFTSPLEALAAARSKAPELLISDVVMPGFSWIDLAIQMKAQYPECKVLLFSGRASTQNLLEGAHDQGHDFQLLQKPITRPKCYQGWRHSRSATLSQVKGSTATHRGIMSDCDRFQLLK